MRFSHVKQNLSTIISPSWTSIIVKDHRSEPRPNRLASINNNLLPQLVTVV